MKILITGPQGSGKTTQAKLLAEKFGVCFIDAGEMIREKVLEHTSEGRELEEELEEGELVDDHIAASLVRDKITSSSCKNGFIVDGYPRTLRSLELFDPALEKVFYLKISDEEAEKRLLQRGREDDKPEVIRERLQLYHKMTEPVLNHYRQLGKLVEINGTRAIEQVRKDIEDNLEGGA
ncbi:MAG: nucleoside monophosphate kinase [Patescibacteria group bacterium]|nr:nucleoside monophosphate kinase [Patescibacteria group bacterium]